MSAKRRLLLGGSALIGVVSSLAVWAWSQLPNFPVESAGARETRLPPLEPSSRTVPPVRPGGDWAAVPGMEGLPLPADSVEAAIAIYRPLVRMWAADSMAYARGVAFLAGLEAAVGHVEESETHYEEARGLLAARAPRSEELAWLHNQQGLSRANRGDHGAAIESFHAAQGAFPKASSDFEEKRAFVEQNRATSYFALGEVEAAERDFLAALQRLAKGPAAPRLVATVRQNLAGLQIRMGAFVAAETELERALAAVPSSDRLLKFSILNNLGDALRAQRRHEEADQRFREAASLTGQFDWKRLAVLNRLSNYWESGDLEATETLLGEAREIFRATEPTESTSLAFINLDLIAGRLAFARARYSVADELFGKVEVGLRARSRGSARFFAEVLAEHSLAADRLGDRQRALALGREAFDLELGQLDQLLAFGSELQRLEYQQQARPFDHLANLGDADLLASAVLTAKGAVLDSLMVERRAARAVGNGAGRAVLQKIRDLRLKLLSARAQGQADTAEALTAELKRQESALAEQAGRSIKAERAALRVEQIQGALEPGAVLVELLEYRSVETGGRSVPSFGALVIPTRGAPRWLPLGPTAPVEGALETLFEGVAAGSRGAERTPSRETRTPSGALKLLSDLLWQPIAAVLPPAVHKIAFAPDGALHFVPWAALLDTEDRFVAERFEVLTLSTGRDLLVPLPGPPDKTMLVLGDGRGDLPYARLEAEWLDREASKQGWQSTLLLGEAATEVALRARRGPSVLHFATHGDVLEAAESESIQARLSRQPMYRGYLTLGGTQATLRAWREGRVVPVEQDGLLTAEEVADLELETTELTVLSACDTGRGESRDGEGILGLRRGFALAGSRHLLFTLWPVDDRLTAAFMTDFYSAYFAQNEAASAFAKTQRRRLAELRQSEGVLGAVRLAGGFVFGR